MHKFFLTLFIIIGLSSAVLAATYKISPNTSTTTQKVNIYSIDTNYKAEDNFPVIEIIADYSGSLGKHINNVREKIAEVTSAMSPDTQLGLRVAGIDSNNNCQTSTELVLPVNTHSTDEISRALYKHNAVAPVEPLTLSLELAVYNDLYRFSSKQKKKIILITDGHETCPADPCGLIRRIMSSRNDIVVDVIITPKGMDNNFRCLADVTGGKVYKTQEKSVIKMNGKKLLEHDPVLEALTDSIKTEVETVKKQEYEYIKN